MGIGHGQLSIGDCGGGREKIGFGLRPAGQSQFRKATAAPHKDTNNLILLLRNSKRSKLIHLSLARGLRLRCAAARWKLIMIQQKLINAELGSWQQMLLNEVIHREKQAILRYILLACGMVLMLLFTNSCIVIFYGLPAMRLFGILFFKLFLCI
jgi:hypothetical protein